MSQWREKKRILFSSSLVCGIIIEAIENRLPIYKLKNLSPISEYEIDLLDMLKEHPPIVSYAIYIFFYKMRNIANVVDRENIDIFFIDLEILYVLQTLLNDAQLTQDDVARHARGFVKIMIKYKDIVDRFSLYFTSSNTDKEMISKSNISNFFRTYKTYTFSQEINELVEEAKKMAKKYYADFIGNKVSDIFALIVKATSSTMDIHLNNNFHSRKIPPESFVISLNPPIWTNEDFTVENLLSSFLLRNISDEAYRKVKVKNLFFYFIRKDDESRDKLLSSKLKEIFIYDLANSLDKKRSVQKLFDEDFSETIYDDYASYINIEQIKNEKVRAKVKEKLMIDLTTKKTEEELTIFFQKAVYDIAMLFSYDKDCSLFYSKNILEDKDLVGCISELINQSLKQNSA